MAGNREPFLTNAHFLEFQRPGERRIGERAGAFLAQAMAAGGFAVAIATPANGRALAAHIEQSDRFLLFDSSEMLARFATRDAIDVARFDAAVGALIRDLKQRAGDAPLHAFGDMVGVLWQRDERQLAVDLEHAWSLLQERVGFSLYCAYPIDVFGPEFCGGALEGVLASHSRLTPAPASAELGRALELAMKDVLGAHASYAQLHGAARAAAHWAAMPKLEGMILSLRDNLPEHADAIMSRARQYYDNSAPRTYLRQQRSTR